jgi:rfaE bifunctional protein kinase chain/domain
MPYSKKIISTKAELQEFSELCSKENRSLALCHGHFNVIHPGHMRFLHHAREHGSCLVVALISDAALASTLDGHHYYPQEERASAVAALEYTDHVVILDSITLPDLITALPALILVMGKEFETERRPEVEKFIEAVMEKNGRVVFHSGEISYSTSEMFHSNTHSLQRERNSAFLRNCLRLQIKPEALIRIIDNFKSRKLLVLGDTIVDQFVACDAIGMSAEAPVIVLRELEKNQYIGGAAIVAAHVRALGAECHFVSAVGDDNPGEFVKDQLNSMGIKSELFVDRERPTTYKVRYMVQNQKMFRVSRLEENSIPVDIENQIIEKLQETIPAMDGVIVSDFVYGVVTPNILKAITSTAKANKVRLFGDLQCSSQIGSVLKFTGFDFISPTEREARIALGDHDSGLEKLAMNLLRLSDSKGLIITLGANGFIAYHNYDGAGIASQHFPALCANPIDVAGAGDTLISAMALGCCTRAGFMKSAALGTCAAAISVNRIGNIPVTLRELKTYVREILRPLEK